MLPLRLSQKFKSRVAYFSKLEWGLWGVSVLLIVVSFVVFDRTHFLTPIASLVGVTSLIFSAKGNPIGACLMVLFSVLYGIISFASAYYGEMITYLGMTAPMSIVALISWLRNPYEGNRAEVRVNRQRLKKAEIVFMLGLTALVTGIFYYVLAAFHTANLIPSTLSVTTSFLAVYLTARRSAFFALAYAANDLVLLVLWTSAALADLSYVSVVICFVVFFANDLYGFISWSGMRKRQEAHDRG